MKGPDRVFSRVLILLGDGSPALAAARLGVRLAAASRGRIRACFVVEHGVVYAMGAPVVLREHVRDEVVRQGERSLARVRALCRTAKVAYQGRLLHGHLGAEIGREARRFRPQVIVMATLGRGRLGAFLLGSRAQEVVGRAPCPVLLVPVRGRATPGGRRAGA